MNCSIEQNSYTLPTDTENQGKDIQMVNMLARQAIQFLNSEKEEAKAQYYMTAAFIKYYDRQGSLLQLLLLSEADSAFQYGLLRLLRDIDSSHPL